jgi:branched-chain amino acid transport system substrate-binding protein
MRCRATTRADAGRRPGRGQAATFDQARRPDEGHERVGPIDSPRGAFTLSKASHNPVQDIYLRQVVGRENKVVGVASKALADPGRGCRM